MFHSDGTGIDATVAGNRGGSRYACPTNIVIDGSEDRSIAAPW